MAAQYYMNTYDIIKNSDAGSDDGITDLSLKKQILLLLLMILL